MFRFSMYSCLFLSIATVSVFSSSFEAHRGGVSVAAPSTANAINLGGTQVVILRDVNLDQILRDMPIAGRSGRYPIGGASLVAATTIMQRIRTGESDFSSGDLSRFLICVAAALRIDADPRQEIVQTNYDVLRENNNVHFSGGHFSGYTGNTQIARISLRELLDAYQLLRQRVAQPTVMAAADAQPATTGGRSGIARAADISNSSAASFNTTPHSAPPLYDCLTTPSHGGPSLTSSAPLQATGIDGVHGTLSVGFDVAHHLRTRHFFTQEQTSNLLFRDLRADHMRLNIVYIVPENRIPYILLRRNQAGLYEIPVASDTVNYTDVLQSRLGGFDTSRQQRFNPTNTPMRIHVLHPSFDGTIRAHNNQQARAAHVGLYSVDDVNNYEYILVRSVNLGTLRQQLAGYHAANDGFTRVTEDGRLFSRVGQREIEIAPSALLVNDYFSGYCGFMHRVSDTSIYERALSYLPSGLPSGGIAAPTLQNLPPVAVHAPAPALAGGGQGVAPAQSANAAGISASVAPAPQAAATPVVQYAPVPLSSEQDTAIRNILRNTVETRDPRRAGNDFTDIELGMAATIMQVSPNGHNGYMTGLCRVFSTQRAAALMNHIVNGDDF